MNMDYAHSKLLAIVTLGAVLGLPFAVLLNLVYLAEFTVFIPYLIGMVSLTIYAAGVRYLNIKSIVTKKKLIFSIIWLGITGAIIGSRINVKEIYFAYYEVGCFLTIFLVAAIIILARRGYISLKNLNSFEDFLYPVAGIGAFIITLLWVIFGSTICLSQGMIGSFSGFVLGAIYGFFVGRFSDYIYSLNQRVEDFFGELLKKKSGASSMRKTKPYTTTNEIPCQKCGTKNKKTADFCKGCGEKLTRTDSNRCMNCGTKNPKDADTCKNCGESLGGTDVW